MCSSVLEIGFFNPRRWDYRWDSCCGYGPVFVWAGRRGDRDGLQPDGGDTQHGRLGCAEPQHVAAQVDATVHAGVDSTDSSAQTTHDAEWHNIGEEEGGDDRDWCCIVCGAELDIDIQCTRYGCERYGTLWL